MSSIIYRSATLNDAGRIVDFQVAMARETEDITLDREICTRGVKNVFEDSIRGRYFVAEKDGCVVASTLVTYEWSDWRNGIIWWIQSVYVVPETRRQGIYSGLYAYLKAIAQKDVNVCGIRLYVDQRNANAQRVYAQLGMNGDHYRVFEWMKVCTHSQSRT